MTVGCCVGVGLGIGGWAGGRGEGGQGLCCRLGEPRPERDIDLNPETVIHLGMYPGTQMRTQEQMVDDAGLMKMCR